jgi:hypothetical protein
MPRKLFVYKNLSMFMLLELRFGKQPVSSIQVYEPTR